MFFDTVKRFHTLWAEEKSGATKDFLWDAVWQKLLKHFNGDYHKTGYALDLMLTLYLDKKYGPGHMKDICKYHCMDARDF